ncbi:MAG TPA: AAA family ATPase [Eubacteriales bacterium]|nr:AAA family ATPase [Eubacteriales bacterium]
MDSVRIMLAAFSAEDRKAAASLLQDETLRIVCSLRPDKNGLKKAGTQPADVLLICTRAVPEEEFDFAERMYTTRSDITILMLTPKPSSQDVFRAMESGIARVIDMDAGVDVIKTNIITSANRDQNRRKSIAKVASYDSRIIQFFSAKGGVGKTTLAVNVACALAAQNKKVALIDLNLQFGDVGVFLDITKGDTIADMVEENSFELATMKSYLIRHYSGVLVLLSTSSPEYAELIRPENIETILSTLRSEFDYIVVDSSNALNDCAVSSFELADTIYFVVNEDIAALYDAKRSMKVLEALNLGDKIKVVINKEGGSTIRIKDVSNLLEAAPALVVPADLKAATTAINRGIPMVLCEPRSKASAAIMKYAKSLVRRA